MSFSSPVSMAPGDHRQLAAALWLGLMRLEIRRHEQDELLFEVRCDSGRRRFLEQGLDRSDQGAKRDLGNHGGIVELGVRRAGQHGRYSRGYARAHPSGERRAAPLFRNGVERLRFFRITQLRSQESDDEG